MAFSLDTIADDILAYLRANFAQPVYEDYIPDAFTLRRNEAGQVEPYIVIQFGDAQPGVVKSFGGAEDDDYDYPIYVQAIAPEAISARKLGNKVVKVLTGYEPGDWSGTMRKRAGFNQFTINSSSGAVAAYAAPRFFTLVVQLADPA